MPVGPPEEVKEIIQVSRHKDLSNKNAKSSFMDKLSRLAKSKNTWYIVLTLSLGAAGWSVVRRFMELKDLKGVGEKTVEILARAGEKLGVRFRSRRVQYLERQMNRYINLVVDKKLSPYAAAKKYSKLFKESDPAHLSRALQSKFAAKGNWKLGTLKFYPEMVYHAARVKS